MNSDLERRIKMLELELAKLKKTVLDRQKNPTTKLAPPKLYSNDQYREALRLAEYQERATPVDD